MDPTSDLDGTLTWRTLWAETTRRVQGDRPIARWICETASGADGDEFLDVLEECATERMVAHLDAMVDRYLGGEPLQYVLGRWAFRRLDVLVDTRVLIPRPETELIVDHAVAAIADRPRPWLVADLGTGSGVIGLSIAAERSHDGLEVWLTDVSPDAAHVARANAAGIGRGAAAVRVVEGSWYDALPDHLCGRLDLIVSNPPYIAPGDPEVEDVVHTHEPHLALYAPDDGLGHLRTIVSGAVRWLAPGGAVITEIGRTQGEPVAAAMRDVGLVEVRVLDDLAGHPRFVQAKRAAT